MFISPFLLKLSYPLNGEVINIVDLHKDVMADILGQLETTDFDYKCDNCGKDIKVKIGKNICPNCHSTINVKL